MTMSCQQMFLLLVHRMSGLDTLEFGDDRGLALIDLWLARLDARLARLV